MYICFTASESVEMPVPEQVAPIQHYLRQPQRLVQAIANPKFTEQLSESRFKVKMRPLNFMEIYHFQPTVILNVEAGASGIVYLKSEGCEILGIDYINQRFSLNVKGKLFPYQNNGKTYLKGRADLEVKVEIPPALWLTPKPLLETAGNGLLKSVLLRIRQKLVSQLLKDYCQWASSNKERSQTISPETEIISNLLTEQSSTN